MEQSDLKAYEMPKWAKQYESLYDCVNYFYLKSKDKNIELLESLLDKNLEVEYYQRFSREYLLEVMEIPSPFYYLTETNVDHYYNWMYKDSEKLFKLLEDDFFKEYLDNEEIYVEMYRDFYRFQESSIYYKNVETFNFYDSKYYDKVIYIFTFSHLILYTIMKAQSYALVLLDEEDTLTIERFWLPKENLDDAFDFNWNHLIKYVFDGKGIKWFINKGKQWKEYYLWAFQAIGAIVKTQYDHKKLKEDMMLLYSEMLITLTAAGLLENNYKGGTKDLLKQSEYGYDEGTFELLKDTVENKISMLNELKYEDDYLKEAVKMLKLKIQDYQKELTPTVDTKIEHMLFLLNSVAPKDLENNSKIDGSLWNSFSEASKRDILLSLFIANNVMAYDLALLPIFRTIEREIWINYFSPYYNSQEYKDSIKAFFGDDDVFIVIESLVKQKNKIRTLENINNIGKALQDKPQEENNFINSFSRFLGDEIDNFINLSNLIETYQIGNNNLKILNIIKGIAHGGSVIKDITLKEYEEVFNIMYEAPNEIFSLIFKKNF